MPNEEDRKWLYGQFKDNGYDTGSYDDFVKSLDNDEDFEWWHKEATSLGLEVGDLKEFGSLFRTPKEEVSLSPEQTALSDEPDLRPLNEEARLRAEENARKEAEAEARMERRANVAEGRSMFDEMRRAKGLQTVGERVDERNSEESAPSRSAQAPTSSVSEHLEQKREDVQRFGTGGEGYSEEDAVRYGKMYEEISAENKALNEDIERYNKSGSGDYASLKDRERALETKKDELKASPAWQEYARLSTAYQMASGIAKSEPSARNDYELAEAAAMLGRNPVARAMMGDEAPSLSQVDFDLNRAEAGYLESQMETADRAKRKEYKARLKELNREVLDNEYYQEDVKLRIADTDDQLGDVVARMNEIESRYNKTGNPQSVMLDQEYRNLNLAAQNLAQTKRKLEHIRDKNAGDFWVNFMDVFTDVNTYNFNITNLETALATKLASKNPEAAGSEELVSAVAGANEVSAEEGKFVEGKGKYGQIAAQSIPFMLQIGLTGGFGGVAEAVEGRFAKAVGEKAADKFLVKATGAVLGDLAAGFVAANTIGGAKTMTDILNNYYGTLVSDGEGGFKYEGGQGLGRSVWGAEVGNTLEYASERAGDHMQHLLGRGILGWGIRSAQRNGRGSVNLAVEELAKTMDVTLKDFGYRSANQASANWAQKALGGFFNISNRMGVQGYPFEVFEEYVGLLGNIVVGGEEKWMDFSKLGDKETHADIWGGMLYSIGVSQAGAVALGTGGLAYSGIEKARFYHQLETALSNNSVAAKTLLGDDEWAKLKEEIDGTTNEELAKKVVEYMDNPAYDTRQRAAILDYVKNSYIYRGYNAGTLAQARERLTGEPGLMSLDINAEAASAQDQVSDAYMLGYDLSTKGATGEELEQLDARSRRTAVDAMEQQKEISEAVERQKKRLADLTVVAEMSGEDASALLNDQNVDQKIRDAALDYLMGLAVEQGFADGEKNRELQKKATFQAGLEKAYGGPFYQEDVFGDKNVETTYRTNPSTGQPEAIFITGEPNSQGEVPFVSMDGKTRGFARRDDVFDMDENGVVYPGETSVMPLNDYLDAWYLDYEASREKEVAEQDAQIAAERESVEADAKKKNYREIVEGLEDEDGSFTYNGKRGRLIRKGEEGAVFEPIDGSDNIALTWEELAQGAEAAEEEPVETTEEETGATEDVQEETKPKFPLDKNGNPIYDAPGVSVEDALADMYTTEGLDEADVDEYIINRANEAEKGRAVKQGKMSLKEWGQAKKEANRKADFWKEMKTYAEENKAAREKAAKEEAARQELIKKYGVDTSKFDLTPQTAEEAVADYLGGEKIINLDDAIRETLGKRKDGRVPSELFRHLGAHGILTKDGGMSVADVARDIVGEYGDTVAIDEDEARDLIIQMLLGKTKREINETIFNNRLDQAREAAGHGEAESLVPEGATENEMNAYTFLDANLTDADKELVRKVPVERQLDFAKRFFKGDTQKESDYNTLLMFIAAEKAAGDESLDWVERMVARLALTGGKFAYNSASVSDMRKLIEGPNGSIVVSKEEADILEEELNKNGFKTRRSSEKGGERVFIERETAPAAEGETGAGTGTETPAGEEGQGGGTAVLGTPAGEEQGPAEGQAAEGKEEGKPTPAPAENPAAPKQPEIKLRPGDILLRDMADEIDPWAVERLEGVGFNTGMEVLEADLGTVALDTDIDMDAMAEIYDIIRRRLNGEEKAQRPTRETAPKAEKKEEKKEEEKAENPSESPEKSVTSQKEEKAPEEPAAPQELTEEQIRKSGYPDADVIESAVDYVNGERGFAETLAYNQIKEYVGTQRTTTEQAGETSGQSQLDEGPVQTSGLGAEQGGGAAEQVDNGENGEGAPGGVGSSDGSVLSGEGGARNDGGAGRKAGAETRGSGKSGRRGGTDKSGLQLAADNGGPEGGQGSAGAVSQSGVNAGSTDIDALGGELEGLLEQFNSTIPSLSPQNGVGEVLHAAAPEGLEQRDRESGKLSRKQEKKPTVTLTLDGMTPQQQALATKIIFTASKLGYAYAKSEGLTTFNDFKRWFKGKFGEAVMKGLNYNESSLDAFMNAAWNTKMSIDGKRLQLREHAADLHNKELLATRDVSIPERIAQQEAANKKGVQVIRGSRKNIAESVPILTPGQWDDLVAIERQFFDDSHNDYDHCYGKGMLVSNGTGTGKTFTGLGTIKRFVDEGKGRVLVVAPASMTHEWSEKAKLLGIKMKELESKKDKGEGVVVTSYENFRDNAALYEDTFDLVVYDESQNIIENQQGMETLAFAAHRMIGNKNVEEAEERLVSGTETGRRRTELRNRYRSLETEKKKPKKKPGQTKEERINEIYLEQNSIQAQINDLTRQLNDMKPQFREKAEEAVKRTKVLFLSATPFNTIANLRYGAGFIFNYPKVYNSAQQEVTDASQREQAFWTEWFRGDAPMEELEVEFGDHLLDELETAYYRILENGYDYSREHPDVSGMVMATRFNAAMNALHKDPKYRPLYDAAKFIDNPLWTSLLYETMKVSAMRDRIKEHIAAGRKIVIFHDRLHRNSGGSANLPPVGPPFKAVMDAALSGNNPGGVPVGAIEAFKREFADVMKWEAGLDYRPVHEQIIDFFATDADRAKYEAERKKNEAEILAWQKEVTDYLKLHSNLTDEELEDDKEFQRILKKRPKGTELEAESVAVYNGECTKKEKEVAKAEFNDDNSKKNIICVTTRSGGAGLSLHDTTGKHQRVMIQTALPVSPIGFIQAEGRIFRWGNKSNAIFEYPRLGIHHEVQVFAQSFNAKAETVENIAHGFRGRGLKDSIMTGFYENSGNVPIDGEGVGGVERDRRGSALKGMAKAKHDYGVAKRKGIKDGDMSVPEPIGYSMATWGKAGNGDVALIPFAGRGSIARYIPKGVTLGVMEQDSALMTDLQCTAGRPEMKVREGLFGELGIMNKADVVILNGSSDQMSGNAVETMSKGFNHLSEGGRLIAVVPDNADTDAELTYIKDTSGGVLRTTIKVAPGALDTNKEAMRIVIIDKVSRAELRKTAPAASEIDLTNVSQEDLFKRLEDIKVPDRIIDSDAIKEKKVKAVLTEIRKNKLIGKAEFRANEESRVRGPEVYIYMTDRFAKGMNNSKFLFQSCEPGYYYDIQKWQYIRLSLADNLNQHSVILKRYKWIKETLALSNEEFKEATETKGAKQEDVETLKDLYRSYLKLVRAMTNMNESQLMRIAQGLRPDISASDIETLNGYSDLREKFEAANHEDSERQEMYDRVAEVAEKLGLTISAGTMDKGFAGGYNNRSNALTINRSTWGAMSDDERATTLLHEFIHSVTNYAVRSADNDVPNMGDDLSKYANMAKDIFKQITKGSVEDVAPFRGYSLENTDEMLAEMANPKVRERYKNRRMWVNRTDGKIKVYGFNVEGAEETTAWELLNEALDGMLKNFDKDLFNRFIGRSTDFIWNLTSPYVRIADGLVKPHELPEGEESGELEHHVLGQGAEEDIYYRTSDEISAEYPNWMDDQTSTEVEGSQRGQNTQVAGTVGTYRKVGGWIESNLGKDTRILDASSGLGLGTIALQEQGFDVEDIEPYPGKGRKQQPTYGGEDAYQRAVDEGRSYDYIISNAVLNVIPDDWRSGVLQNMAKLLAPGGRMFINTRKAGEEKTIKNKIELDSEREVLVGTPERINSYQRFFTPNELKEYVEDELGDGYVVEIANKRNSGTSGLAAVVVTKKGENRLNRRADNLKNPIDRAAAVVKINDISKKLGITFKEDRSLKAKGEFNAKTNEIRINIDAHKNTADIEATLLHEAVAHFGLRKLFGNDWKTLRQQLYQKAEKVVKERIDAVAKKFGLSTEVATEEYIAQLAEDGRFDQQEETFWQRVVNGIKRLLSKIGINAGYFTDEDLRSLLYASYRNLQTGGALETAARVATAAALRRAAEASHEEEDNGPEDDGPGGGRTSETEDSDMYYRFIGEKGAARLDAVSPIERRMETVEVPRRGLARLFGSKKFKTIETAVSRIDNLNTAKRMQSDGVEPAAIKRATGWEMGRDGKWRYEESDVRLDEKFTKSVLSGERFITKEEREIQRLLKDHADSEQFLDAYIDILADKYKRKVGKNNISAEERKEWEEREEDVRRAKKALDDYDQKAISEYLEADLSGNLDKRVRERRKGAIFSISEILAHDNAFKKLMTEYPQLADIKVSFYNDSLFDLFNATRGYYNPETNTMMLNPQAVLFGEKPDVQDLTSVVVHELQHIIQGIEGFASGGNESVVDKYGRVGEMKRRAQEVNDEMDRIIESDEVYKTLKDKLDKMENEYSDEYIAFEEEEDRLDKEYERQRKEHERSRREAWDTFNKELKDLGERKDRNEVSFDEYIRLRDELARKRDASIKPHPIYTVDKWKVFTGRMHKYTYEDLRPLRNEVSDRREYLINNNERLVELDKEKQDLSRELKNERFRLYQSIAGEVEARNVQKRMDMSDEVRRNSLAESTEDVVRAEQIILSDAKVLFNIDEVALKATPSTLAEETRADIEAELQKELDNIDAQLNDYIEEHDRPALVRERAKAIQNAVDKVKTMDVQVATRENVLDRMREDGVKRYFIDNVASQLKASKENGYRINGFNVNGKVYLIADDIATAETALSSYVHERQHEFTKNSDYADAIAELAGYDREKLQGYITALGGSKYDGRSAVLANEFISFAMELAYKTSEEEFESRLREIGVDENIINFVKNIDNEQRNDSSLSRARRTSDDGGSSEADFGDDGYDSEGEPGGYLGREGVGSVERSELQAEEVSESLKNEPEDIREDAENLSVSLDNELHFRKESGYAIAKTADDMYDRATGTVGSALFASQVDEFAPADAMQEAIYKEPETDDKKRAKMKLPEKWRLSNRLRELGGQSMSETRKYVENFMRPMWDAMASFRKAVRDARGKKMSLKDLVRYVALKSGLERNVVFAKRDAKREYQKEYDARIDELKARLKQKKTELEKKLRDGEISDVTYSSRLTALQTDINEKMAEAEARRQAHFAEVDLGDAGNDAKYKEFRKKDYSALMAWFSVGNDLRRRNYPSRKAYNRAVLALQNQYVDGVTDLASAEAMARASVSEIEGQAGNEKVGELWSRINAATKETLDFQVEHNRLSRQQRSDILSSMKYYIPMRGFEDNTAEDFYSYYMKPNVSGFAPTVLAAKGRTTRYDNPFGMIGFMHSSAVSQGLKNEAVLTLLDFVRKYPKNSLATITRAWFVQTGETDADGKPVYEVAYPNVPEGATAEERDRAVREFEEEMAEKKARGEAYNAHREVQMNGGVVAFERDSHKNEHVVKVYEGGKEYGIIINGNPAAAQAINGIKRQGGYENFLEILRVTRRILSSMFTTTSVPFWVSNYQRDALEGAATSFTRNKLGYVGKYILNRWKLLPQMLPLVVGGATKGGKMDKISPKLANYYRMYVENGGPMGQNRIENDNHFVRQMNRYIAVQSYDKANIARGAAAVFNAIASLGEAIETITRFSTFVTSMESGRSLHEAISDSKEVSTNFARKGHGRSISWEETGRLETRKGRQLGDNSGGWFMQARNTVDRGLIVGLTAALEFMRAGIPFFNASIQGLYKKGVNYQKNWAKAALVDAVYLAVGLSMRLFAGGAGGDDDKEKYGHTSDYTRRNNFLTPLGDGKYVKWALPQEYRYMFALGDIAAEAILQEKPSDDLWLDAYQAIAQLLPAGAVDPSESGKGFWTEAIKSIAPGMVTPAIEAYENKDFKGSRIYNEGFNGNKEDDPGWTKAIDTTGPGYVAIAERLNKATGGGEENAAYRGWINLNPAIVEHFVKSYLSGPYQLLGGIGALIGKKSRGEEIKTRDIPVWNRLFMDTNDNKRDAYYSAMYYYFKDRVKEAERLESAMKGHTTKQYEDFRQSEDYAYMLLFKMYESNERSYNRMRKELLNAGDKEGAREIDRNIDDMRAEIAKQCLDVYFDRVDWKSWLE